MKETAGQGTRSARLARQGRMEVKRGKAQRKIGEAEEDVEEPGEQVYSSNREGPWGPCRQCLAQAVSLGRGTVIESRAPIFLVTTRVGYSAKRL